MNLEQKIAIAEKRISEHEALRVDFVNKYNATRNSLYKSMAQNETRAIEEIRSAIIEALIKK